MAGFLDRCSQIVDMVLTHEGQRALSEGRLNFTYWSAFDDGIHYDPWVSESGSLPTSEVTSSKERQIEDTPILEVGPGLSRRNPSDRDLTYAKWPLFTSPQGSSQVPRFLESGTPSASSGSYAIEMKQRRIVAHRDGFDRLSAPDDFSRTIDRGFERIQPSTIDLEYRYQPGSYPPEEPLEGVLIRAYRSGSDGLIEIDPRPDLQNRIALGASLVMRPRRT